MLTAPELLNVTMAAREWELLRSIWPRRVVPKLRTPLRIIEPDIEPLRSRQKTIAMRRLHRAAGGEGEGGGGGGGGFGRGGGGDGDGGGGGGGGLGDGGGGGGAGDGGGGGGDGDVWMSVHRLF